jgi:hypothetical protein
VATIVPEELIIETVSSAALAVYTLPLESSAMPHGEAPLGSVATVVVVAAAEAAAGRAPAPTASKAAAAIAINEFFFDILMGISPVGSRRN